MVTTQAPRRRERKERPLPELTHENLATGIRTLVTMAACWELRDPTATQLDKLQQARLQRVLRELAEGAEAQEMAASQIITTLIHDELAVAIDPTLQQRTWEEVEIEFVPGQPTKFSRPRGNEIVARGGRAEQSPRALMPFGDSLGYSDVPDDALASALLRCRRIFAWLFQYNDTELTTVSAVKIADAIRDHKGYFRMGVQEAVSGALGMFLGEATPRGRSGWERTARKFQTYNRRWLRATRHPDRPGLLPENVDTGRYFGARDRLECVPRQAPKTDPLAHNVAELIADALGAVRPVPEGGGTQVDGSAWRGLVAAIVALERSRFPGLFDPTARGASSPGTGDGLTPLLRRLSASLSAQLADSSGTAPPDPSITE